ncbi:MAG: hypothetical protein K8T90_20990 [Planctomycetes bacterium]|nr:hypothetical protein [Planctomycetota bacterium]
MQSVVAGVVGTFVSRYSDYDGYWLLGFLVGRANPIDIDLLPDAPPSAENSADAYATRLAILRFQEQVDKHHLPMSAVRAARLEIATLPSSRWQEVRGKPRRCWELRVSGRVEVSSGAVYEATTTTWVGPHLPWAESRRHSSQWGTNGTG